jgi:hypothetical protein
MEASAAPRREFDHLREHSIGLPGVLFQSITHMAPAAAVAYSIYISVPHAGAALPLAVFLALIACLLAANSIGQLAKELPSAGAFNLLLHGIFPVAGIVLFAFPLYYQYFPLPAYPIRYAVWVALGWIGAGLVLGLVMWKRNPEALRAGERIYVAEEPDPGFAGQVHGAEASI